MSPVTLGVPHWRRRHRHALLAVHAAAVGCSPVLYLLWQRVVGLPLVAVVLSVLALSVAGRLALSVWLHHLRRRGRAMSTVLAVGAEEDVTRLVDRCRRTPGLGWRVRGVCTPTGAGPGGSVEIAGVPVVGDLDTVSALALARQFDAVAVGPAPGWTPVRLQQLAWDVDCSRTALLVDPRLVQLVGPRQRVTGVDGLPLLRLDHPTLRGARLVLKEVCDRLAALAMLALVAPVLVGAALAIRRDGGPVLQRRTRVGRGGREFALLTFRTTSATDGKPTPAGRLLYRHCLDELPQLLNVVTGAMALVGPRPAAPSEIAAADRGAQRRLLLKPGITGLWQLDEADGRQAADPSGAGLRYAENWTPAVDARILRRTVRAALADRAR